MGGIPFLDDALRAGDAFAAGVGRAVNDLGRQAGQAANAVGGAVSGAGNVGTIDSRGHVHGAAAQVFGSDPVTFILNVTKHFVSNTRTLINRCAGRVGASTFTADKDGKKIKIDARATSKDSTAHLALLLALHAGHHPRQLIDEAGRMAAGVGPGRGLNGCVDWPSVMVRYPNGEARGLDEARGVFLVDDAAIFGGVITLIVAIIGVVGPVVITALVSVVGSVAPAIGETIQNAIGGKPPAPQKDPLLFGLDPMMILIGAAAIAAYLLLGKKKAIPA